MNPPLFFDGWEKLGRSALLALLAYLALVLMIRLSGKRTISKLNVFDFVFVVALGSTLADTILSTDITLADGVFALGVLIVLQVLLARLCVSSHRMDTLINGEPTLLLHRGRFLQDAMQRERVTAEEVMAAVREEGLARVDVVDAVVLETDGSFSVVWRRPEGATSSLQDVPGHPEADPAKRPET